MQPRVSMFVDEIYDSNRPLDEILAFVRRIGVEYIDLRVVDGTNSFFRLSDDELEQLRRTLAKAGVKVAALGTPLFKCPLRGHKGPTWGVRHGFEDVLGYEEHLKLLPRAFEIADKFGVTNVRCFAFWREYDPNEVFDEVADKLGHAARVAGELGHALALENEMATLVGTGLEQARMLKAVASPHLSGIYDHGNSGRLGGTPYPDDYAALRGLISRIHIKFEVVDVFCGWLSRLKQWDHPHSPYSPVMPWAQADVPISGRLTIGDTVVEIEGDRTFLPVTNAVRADYRALLTALKNDGYTGDIVCDTGFQISRAEATVRNCMGSLQTLIGEVWGPN